MMISGTEMHVVAVSLSPSHTMSKGNATSIVRIAGLGVEGDAHAGTTVKHRAGGRVSIGDPMRIELPEPPFDPLQPV
ncbi:MAG: hypothetical protein ABI432_13345 [Flavobacteriales bacterium]